MSKPCPKCDGRGELHLTYYWRGYEQDADPDCDVCDGTGEVPDDYEEDEQ